MEFEGFLIFSKEYARLGGAEQAEPSALALATPVIITVADTSTTAFDNYTALRTSDNRYYINAYQWIDFAPNQVKINNGNRSALIGTDGNDAFDASYYAAYSAYFNNSLLVNFYAGAGNDMMGGSARNDNLWGGTGNDTLFGYDGNDNLYGEDGNDELQGGAGNDRLFGRDCALAVYTLARRGFRQSNATMRQ